MEEAPFYRDTWVEVDLDAIYNNVTHIKEFIPSDVEIFAVVKANAYGHDYVPVAKTALEAGATRLAVAFLDEALVLRRAGITVPILVLGPSPPRDVNVAAENDVALTVFQKEWVDEAIKLWDGSSVMKFHINFDSGMGRIGIRERKELKAFLKSLEGATFLELEGVYTHFATADEVETSYFDKQYNTFLEQLSWLKEFGVDPKFVHTANSAATLRFQGITFNAVRIGIAMYGLSPSVEIRPFLPFELEPALSLHTKVAHIKQVIKGDGISYNVTYRTKTEEWIATVAIGYADGWLRRLQGFEVLINGKRVPIVGRVTMDQFMIHLPCEVPLGTKVTLIGRQGDEYISATEVAEYSGTINYEIIATISFRVPRIFIRNGKVVEIINYLNNI
ncbi:MULTISPECIES: alanine racemase [Bacillus]|uniref:alanine racemase n=1 Tax=Bacillus TaxID=1386 RepID=UPI000BFA7813|nr:alanine racemase [Bacillus thuringiensis]PEV37386.1 alanine racemase [Bacillus thuringiensis]PEW23500.1 alanine racemase [Bacillus thuringiensis]PEZ27457.1 alanine racemase [Bacillus thuringiensis]PFF68290.1 alanine racemase [Bacillus thuringiensis]PFR66151.1 alanine racemase [Bacillus thuringiensis]